MLVQSLCFPFAATNSSLSMSGNRNTKLKLSGLSWRSVHVPFVTSVRARGWPLFFPQPTGSIYITASHNATAFTPSQFSYLNSEDFCPNVEANLIAHQVKCASGPSCAALYTQKQSHSKIYRVAEKVLQVSSSVHCQQDIWQRLDASCCFNTDHSPTAIFFPFYCYPALLWPPYPSIF